MCIKPKRIHSLCSVLLILSCLLTQRNFPLGSLLSEVAQRVSGSERHELPDWPVRLRQAHSTATEWRWRMMKGGLKRTSSVPWCVMEARERGGETVLAFPALGAGHYPVHNFYIAVTSHYVLCIVFNVYLYFLPS